MVSHPVSTNKLNFQSGEATLAKLTHRFRVWFRNL